jgi:hypothetical protein
MPYLPQCNNNLLLLLGVTFVNNPRLEKSLLARPKFYAKSVAMGTVATGNQKINKLTVPSLKH